MATALPRSTRLGGGQAPGTCGELLQGTLPDGRRFLVSCPIERGAAFAAALTPAPAFALAGVPSGSKVAAAVRLATELLELGPVEIVLRRRAGLPVAKGLASSSADIVAAVRAVAAAAGCTLTPAELARLAATVEPSDPVMHAGPCAFDPDRGLPLRDWPWRPAFAVAVVVPRASRVTGLGGARSVPAGLALRYAGLLGRLDDAVARRDDATFAEVAVASAALNERAVPSPVLPALRRAAARSGALGWCVGHSGTAGGVLLPLGDEEAAADAAAHLRRLVPTAEEVFVTRTPARPRTEVVPAAGGPRAGAPALPA